MLKKTQKTRVAPMKNQSLDLSRRKLLLGALQAAGLVLFSGCEKMFNGLQQNSKFLSLLESAEGANRRLQKFLTGRNKLAQEFTEKDISRYFKPNGNPPPLAMDYMADAASQWQSWRLEVSGLVQQPHSFSLTELKSMPARTQITRHDCVEGWSAIGKWKGVRLEEIMRRVQPQPRAKYVVFHCMDTDSDGTHYYESIDLEDAVHPQTILAYEMNDAPLPVEHGAPLRLRVENQLGYKMAKYIRAIEFVADLKNIQQGKGGYWEDQGYEWYAGI
jgi:DMSO/TMAO reductase YedYZ molybdopterin-dependent catalytic subunit